MEWTQAIDAYCERTSAALWAEPVNAASNLAFLLAAGFGWVLHRRFPQSRALIVFAALAGVIGVGSFLFHTFANRWSVLADTVPIAVFIHAYFGFALHRLVGLGKAAALGGTAAFFGLSILLEPALSPILGSSAAYAGALLALFGIGSWLACAGRPAKTLVLGAGAVFTVSLAFRMADGPICEALPLGTHFLWHILNAAVLALLIRAAAPLPPRGPGDRS
ncbi:ceramidase domain-containing protein [Aurantimonas sp. Leaf443]|uniref:ceramidase domain-containing protein n=1 Tax=Aurantimonas sp. Leaf443 TaxID=1736378 RepID=UPI0006FEC7A6|nr:ceramidase domain-containing protein [Aurantimonas sp. Leaf443]KQT83993.1 hypothetical protein ASG48_11460 [Aurantimonas sp. Leaf443]